MTPPKPGKAAHNERRKLLATALNTIGVGVFLIGGVTPIMTRTVTALLLVQFLASGAIFVLLHWLAQRVLSRVED